MVVIEDRRARHGVVVNGVRVESVELSHADVIQLADEQFVYMEREDVEEERVVKAFLTSEMPLEVYNDWREERGYWLLTPSPSGPVPSEDAVLAKIVQEMTSSVGPVGLSRIPTVDSLSDYFSCDRGALSDLLERMALVALDGRGRVMLSGNLSHDQLRLLSATLS